MAALRTHAEVSETGQSGFAVRIQAGKHTLIGDEPTAAGGADLGPSPFELLTAALAECTAMTVRWFARERGWPLEHVAVAVNHRKKVLVGAPAPVDVFEKTITIRGPTLSPEQRARLLEIADRCPVHRVLEGTPLITSRPGTPGVTGETLMVDTPQNPAAVRADEPPAL